MISYCGKYCGMVHPPAIVVSALRWYAQRFPGEDYGYTGDWRDELEYCCDRMNGGRARAILRLMKVAGVID
jgi:hypothetical protein